MALPFPTAPGDGIYKFKLLKRVGGGNFGEVWLAHDRAIQCDVAVKLIDASQATIDELLQEAVVGNRAGHPNLVKVHYADVVNVNGHDAVAVAMDYHPNGSVVSQACAGNLVRIDLAVSQIIDVLRGLEHLHEQGTLHNDIKPNNILVGAKGEGILTDYGISVVTDGKAAYAENAYRLHAAPEIVANLPIGFTTDVYQVGLTAFRMINGLSLIRAKRDAVGSQKFSELVCAGKLIRSDDYRPFVPSSLKRVLNKAINPDPKSRYQSALEMRRALEKLHLVGGWSLGANGLFCGEDAHQTYRYEAQKLRGGTVRFNAFRASKSSGKESKIGKFSMSGLSELESARLASEFMKSVVEGKK